MLFEINRKTLHPLGLALEVFTGADNGFTLTWTEDGVEKKYYIGEEAFGNLWDYRDDPEGVIYGEESYKDGKKKYDNFMKESGNKKLEDRKKVLGYIVQKK